MSIREISTALSPIGMMVVAAFLCVGVIITVDSCAGASEPLPADRVTEIKQYDSPTYCNFIAVLYAQGIKARNEGKPNFFKAVDDGDPTEAIWVVGFDTYTNREKMFVMEHMSAGWHHANEQFLAGPKPIGASMVGADRYLADCLLIEQHRQYNKGER